MPIIMYKPLGDYLRLIRTGETFSFSRYWDGELSCILGREGKNCDACTYTLALREALRRTISNDLQYYHSLYFPIHSTGTPNLRRQFQRYLEEIKSPVEWYDALIWQRAVEENKFTEVIQALRERQVLFIGGEHLMKLKQEFPLWKYMVIPAVNAHSQHASLLPAIRTQIVSMDNSVVILCAGMESNVLIDDLFPLVGQLCTMLDMGSVWDAYLGLKTRIWIRSLNNG